MRIVRRTAEELHLRRLPLLPWCVGGLLLVLGAWTLLSANEEGRVVLDCQRPAPNEGTCHLRAVPLIGPERSALISATDLEEAFLRTTWTHGRSSDQVVLRTRSGQELPLRLPVGRAVSGCHWNADDTDERRALVTRLNQFLQGDAPAVHHVEDHRVAAGALALALLLLGWLVALGAGGRYDCLLSRDRGTLTLRRLGLFGIKSIEHQLSQLRRVRTATSPRGAATVTLVIGSGETIELARFGSRHQPRRDQLVAALRAFIGHD